jgi:hypothetical protein
LIPARLLPVVAADVEPVVDHDGPDPGRGAVRDAVFPKRRDMQVVCLPILRSSSAGQFVL